MLSVNFNGHELNEYIGVLSSFTLLKGAEFFLGLQDIDGGNGSRIFNAYYGPKTIPMPFMARNDLINKYDELQRILKVDEPKPLIFGNAPDRIYYAMPVGDMDMDEFLNFGKGTITWLVPDGLSHATTETTVTAIPNADGVLEATIVNDGTAPAILSYDITHKSDNGYIGIVSEDGVMEFGSREELDGEDYQANDILKVSNFFEDWDTPNGPNGQNVGISSSGILSEKDFNGQNGLYLSNAGTGNYWHGGMKTLTLPADSQGEIGSENLYSYFNHVFVAGLQSQTGIFMLNFLDDKGKAVCSYHVYKSSPASGTAVANMWVGGDRPHIWKSFNFVPFPDQERNQFANSAGHCSMQKSGDYFTFYWRNQAIGGTHVPELKDVKIVAIQYFIGQYGNRTLSAPDYMSYNFLRNISFTKLNVEKWSNSPNRYSDGTILTIDGETKKPYANGMLAIDDEVVGTKYFKASVGESKIKFYPSSWCEILPEIKIRYRKAWL